MLKITCSNPICGSSFFFDEKRNQNATKVRCPKCKGITSIDSIEEDDKEDWLRTPEESNVSSPVFSNDLESPILVENNNNIEEEDFFTSKTTRNEKAPPIVNNINNNPQTSANIGWLVVHDEFTESAIFTLRKGVNHIGRLSHSCLFLT